MSVPPLHIRSWSEQDFGQSRAEWQSLLARSAADPLFMSWDWQWRWWKHHAEYLRATLRLQGLYTASGELVGIAAFHVREVRFRGLVKLRRMELLGGAWRDSGAAFSEYLDLIAARGYEDAVLAAVAAALQADQGWHDLALPCLKPNSLASRLAREHIGGFTHVREVDAMEACSASLEGTFSAYVEKLSSGTRRRLLHHRRKLDQPALLAAGPAEVEELMQSMRNFEQLRWGPKSDRQYRFSCDFALAQAEMGTLRLTKLLAGDRILSVMYNVRIGDTEYYLQSAFDGRGTQGLSPGYLHFGYRMESAALEGVTRFDFLAGPGRHRDYKQDLLTVRFPLISCHAVRLNWLRWLHGIRDALHRPRAAGRPGGGPIVSQFVALPTACAAQCRQSKPPGRAFRRPHRPGEL